jgi:hypothetical protein
MPDSVDSHGDSGGGSICGDHGEAADDGKHSAGLGCGRWWRDLEVRGKLWTEAAQELGRGRGTT